MGELGERCKTCGHLIAVHDPVTGCSDRVPGTKDRMPGSCGCGLPPVLADVIPFRTRSERDALLSEYPEDPHA